jgi:DNA-binding NtrC family response regulator
MMTISDSIDVQDLPAYLQPGGASTGAGATVQAPVEQAGTLEEHERLLIIRALDSAGGNQSQAARSLRIGRDALRYKLKKHNLEASHSERDTGSHE